MTQSKSCSLSMSKQVIFFIPGNPGLIDYYELFLDRMRSYGHTVIALAHLMQSLTLQEHVKDKLAKIDHYCSIYKPSKVVLVGHSVGCWMIGKIVKVRKIDLAVMLCPTLSWLSLSVAGRKLARVLIIPGITTVCACIATIIPSFLLHYIMPKRAAHITASQLLKFQSVFSALYLAKDELDTIKELDKSMLANCKVVIYFARKDHWVSDDQRAVIMQDNKCKATVLEIDHSFCIHDSQSLQLAETINHLL